MANAVFAYIRVRTLIVGHTGRSVAIARVARINIAKFRISTSLRTLGNAVTTNAAQISLAVSLFDAGRRWRLAETIFANVITGTGGVVYTRVEAAAVTTA